MEMQTQKLKAPQISTGFARLTLRVSFAKDLLVLRVRSGSAFFLKEVYEPRVRDGFKSRQEVSQPGICDVIREPATARKLPVSDHHAKMLPARTDCGERVNPRNRFFCIALRPTVGAVLMAMLALRAPLQARSGQCPVSGSQERSRTAEQRDDYDPGNPEVGVVFDARATPKAQAVDGANPATEPPIEFPRLRPSTSYLKLCAPAQRCASCWSATELVSQSGDPQSAPPAKSDTPGEGSKPPSGEVVPPPAPVDFNQSIYYKNKFEFGLDLGWLPINIPFVFDVFLGDGYNQTPLKYTLVPIIASLRWQTGKVKGPGILRGNWDLTFSGSVTAIPRGPETRYFAYIMGIRRNFVPRRWKVAPYWDWRMGLGDIDAKGPLGVQYSQGQNFTFTLNMGSGVRYNFSPRYSISAGLNWMHISNLYLSQPGFPNYVINVYGPLVGIDVRVGKRQRDRSP